MRKKYTLSIKYLINIIGQLYIYFITLKIKKGLATKESYNYNIG
jgi:hypothetical protein